MLYEYYNAVKNLVGDTDGLESVAWFNNQYDETIINDRVAYVEFPAPLTPNPVSKQMERSEVTIRLHVVSRVLQKIDGAIADSDIVSHETLCQAILSALRGQALTTADGVALTSRLRWSGWQHHHKYLGWMVTWIEFVGNTVSL